MRLSGAGGSGVVLAGTLVTAIAVVAQTSLLAWAYPAAYLDADLLSYLVYYRQLASGEAVPFGYTVPKVLPVFLLGPLGDPRLALMVSTAVAAAGGAVVFVLAARTFGLATAILGSALYVLDPLRSVLTLRSSVDLYMGVALVAATLALRERAVLTASLLILLAALGKPVAAACGLAALVVTDVSLGRRLVATALPLVALPASAMLGAALAGHGAMVGLTALALPDQHGRFVAVAQGSALDLAGSLDLLVVEWFAGTLFRRTWPLVILGVGLYLVASFARRHASRGVVRAGSTVDAGSRTTGPAPAIAARVDGSALVLLVPLLLAIGYLGVSVHEPIIVFTRFFWPLTLALALLAAYAATTLAAHVPGSRAVAGSLLVVLGSALLADRLEDARWRAPLMLDPFEANAAIASRAVDAIAGRSSCEGAAVVPLAYLPLAAWRAPRKLARGELCAVEDWADGRGCARPNCILYIPGAATTARAREALERAVRQASITDVEDAHGALVRSDRG